VSVALFHLGSKIMELNGSTHMGSWDGVMLEGDIEVNYLTWIIS
jgi:hypothetical protein